MRTKKVMDAASTESEEMPVLRFCEVAHTTNRQRAWEETHAERWQVMLVPRKTFEAMSKEIFTLRSMNACMTTMLNTKFDPDIGKTLLKQMTHAEMCGVDPEIDVLVLDGCLDLFSKERGKIKELRKNYDTVCARIFGAETQLNTVKAEVHNKNVAIRERDEARTASANTSVKNCESFVRVETWRWFENGVFGELAVPSRKGRRVLRQTSKNIWYDTYEFRGQPDWELLISETLGNGADVVRVTPVEGSMFCDADVEWDAPLIWCKYRPSIKWEPGEEIMDGYWWCSLSTLPTDVEIEAAIREYHKETPPSSKYAVGDWVVVDTNNEEDRNNGNAHAVNIGQIESRPAAIGTDIFYHVLGVQWNAIYIRPATSADFERIVQGVKVRMYDDSTDYGRFWLYTNTGGISEYSQAHECTIVAFHAFAHVPCDDGTIGIPVIPLSVSGGKFEAPA